MNAAPFSGNNKVFVPKGVAVRFGATVYVVNAQGPSRKAGDSAGITVTRTGADTTFAMVDGTSVRVASLPNLKTADGAGAVNVDVMIPASMRAKVRGLCGNFDGDPANDYIDGNGKPVPLGPPTVWAPDGTALAKGWEQPASYNLFTCATCVPAR